jgi:hypothetical protein
MFPNVTNVTTYEGLLTYNNTVTDGMFGLFLIIGIFLVAFGATGQYRKEVSFTFASFITLVSAVLLSGLGVVGGHIVVICAVVAAGATLYLFTRS